VKYIIHIYQTTSVMPAIVGHVDFNPAKDIPSLSGKVIFVTGGNTALLSPLPSTNPTQVQQE
jgi:hypothetical protein